MARMQYITKESTINYSSTKTDGQGKECRGLPVESDKCRICRKAKKTLMHWLSGCTRLAATEYLKRHNNTLMILCLALGIQAGLLGKKYEMVQRKVEQGNSC